MKKKNYFGSKYILWFLLVNLIFIFNSNVLFINAVVQTKDEKELIPLVLKSSNIEKPVLLEEPKQDLLKHKSNFPISDIKKDKSVPTESISETINPNIAETNLEEHLKCEYQKNGAKFNNVIGWKHDLGSLFSKKIRLFYGIDSISTLPCASFQEWLNLKQFFLCLLDHHVPKINFLFDFLRFSGIKEEFIDDKYEKIALKTSSFYCLLKNNPSLGYFYFKNEDLKDIKTAEIAFCNCQVLGYSILDLINEIIVSSNFDIDNFKEHLNSYCQHLKENINDETEEEEINISVIQFLNQITHNSDMDELEHHLLFHLIKILSQSFMPKNFTFRQYITKKKTNPLRVMCLSLTCLPEKQTLGFLLQIEKQEDNHFYLCFYEIFKTKNDNQEKLIFIDKVLVVDTEKNEHVFFHHLMINISQKKRLFIKKTPLFSAMKI